MCAKIIGRNTRSTTWPFHAIARLVFPEGLGQRIGRVVVHLRGRVRRPPARCRGDVVGLSTPL
jgi:hypothetical protein